MPEADLIMIELDELELRALRRHAAIGAALMRDALGVDPDELQSIDVALAKCELGLMAAGVDVE